MKRLKKGGLLLFLSLLSLAVWLPLLFLASGSLMDSLELRDSLAPVLSNAQGYASWSLLPHFPTLASYFELLLDTPEFYVMFWNTVVVTAGVLMGQLLTALPAAWWFAHYAGNKAGKGLYTVYLIVMLMPFQVTMVSSYLVLDMAGLLNTRWSILLPAAFSAFPVFLMHRSFSAIPKELMEAARIDGANEWQLFWHIGLPMGKAGIVCTLMLGFLECWNMLEAPMAFLKDQTLWPMALMLPKITGNQAGMALAASVAALLPALFVFLYGQGYLEEGIAAGGVKE